MYNLRYLTFFLHASSRPLKNSDINLMDDTHTEWGEEEPDSRRFRV